MPESNVPDEVRRLAEERRGARGRRDFATADRLKAEIEAAGWKLVDRGSAYRLEAVHPPDVVLEGRIRHGWSGSVPSRLAETPVGVASVVIVAPDDPDVLQSLLAALAGAVEDQVRRVVVANAPPPEVETLLVRLEERWASERSRASADGASGAVSEPLGEVVWTANRFGAAAALNSGIRRAASEVVILLDPGVDVGGQVVGPLVAALADPDVAVAGPRGLVSEDLRRFVPADAGATDVTAIDGRAIAFRRTDFTERGPLDERFVAAALLDAWWSLVLRDEGESRQARRAVVVDVPLALPPERPVEPNAALDRDERRNRYRLIDRFSNRRDLAAG